MNSDSSPSATALADYGALVRRHALVIVVCASLGVAAGLVYLNLAPKVFTSTAAVLVNPITVNPQGGSSALNIDTEAQLIKSGGVAASAQAKLGTSTSPSDLIEQVDVTSPTNTDILNISFSASTRADARAGAQAFADAYLANRTSTARSFIDAALSSLQKQSRQAQSDLKSASDSATQLPVDSPGRAFAQAQQVYLGNVLNTLQNKIITLTTADTTPGRVIQDPQLPVSASAPVRSVVLASSLALGLLLGLVLTFIRERRDPRIHTVSDIERGLGVPVLAFLPRPPRRSPQNTVAPPHTALGQAYLRLRNSLVPLTQRSGTLGSVVMVTSASTGTSSEVCASLAVAIARTGAGVSLVCADLHHSRTAEVLDLPSGPGLTDVLEGRHSIGAVTRRYKSLRDLAVVTPGSPSESADDLLHTPVMADVVAQLRPLCDVILLEAPSTSAGAEAQSLAMVADGALLLVEVHRTSHDEVADALRQCERTGTEVLGVVLVSAAPRRFWRRRRAAGGARTVPETASGLAADHGLADLTPPVRGPAAAPTVAP